MSKDFLLVVSDREPLAWLLTEQRMAFPGNRSREATSLSPDDRLFLYTTRGCFHNPTRDRGRVIGEATVASSVSLLKEPIKFGELTFPLGCRLRVTGLASRGEGPEMADLIDGLELFPNRKSWAIRLRRVLAPLNKHDAQVLHNALSRVMKPPQESRSGYLARPSAAPVK
jgi:hypothetical protein